MHRKSPIAGTLILLAALAMADSGTPNSRSLVDPGAGSAVELTAENGAPQRAANPSSTADPRGQTWAMASSVFPGYTIRRTVPEVRLQFSVSDEHGRLLTNLSPSDVRIFDNQSAVERIRQFSRLDELPLQLGILLDVSDSVQKNVVREKIAARFLVQRVLRPQTDRAFLMAFAQEVKLWQSSTGDATALQQALDRTQQQGYTTNLYDGLRAACVGQFPQTGDQDDVQRIIVLFSDGEDTGSLHGMSDVVPLAERNHIQIVALSIHPKREPTSGDKVLQRLSDETGGRFYVAASDKDFPAVFAEMEQQMRTQYAVSFQPQQPTPGFHALHLELTAPQKARVHVRQGYYFEAR